MKRFLKYSPFVIIIFILLGLLLQKDSQIQQTQKVLNSDSVQIESSPLATVEQASPEPQTDQSTVVKIISVTDGDTFKIEGGVAVRMIGIDTPETVDPSRPVGCYGAEASEYTRSNLMGKQVRLEKDVSETDRYGRLLRYVWVEDTLFNEKLVSEGYATAVTYPPDVAYQEQFQKAQQEARTSQKGLWGKSCETQASPTPAVKSATTTSSTAAPTNNNGNKSCKYDCSGPDRDCSDFSSHKEAQDFFNCCGFSSENDPMKLDKATGKGNGLACESLK